MLTHVLRILTRMSSAASVPFWKARVRLKAIYASAYRWTSSALWILGAIEVYATGVVFRCGDSGPIPMREPVKGRDARRLPKRRHQARNNSLVDFGFPISESARSEERRVGKEC